MSIRIYSKVAKDVTLNEEKACKKMVSGGAIYNVFVECCSTTRSPKNRVFIAKDGPRSIAWAIIKQDIRREYQFMVYVKMKYRRKGIGTRLYKRAKKYFNLDDKNITVYRTSNINTKFFNKIQTSYED